MKARIIALTALLILTIALVPAVAQDKQSSAQSTGNTTSTTKPSDKEKEDKDRQAKLEAEYKARAEAEKKKQAEEKQQRDDHNKDHNDKHQPDSAGTDHGASDNHPEKPSASPVAPPPNAVTSATQNQQTSQPVAPSTNTTTTTASDKEKEDKDRQEKLKAEYKARAEAEKRERVEERKEQRYYGYGGGSSASMSMSSGFFDNPFARSSIGLVVAPSNSIGKTAVGLQWISKNRWGIALWNSGSAEDDDVIDAYIPHDDYYTKSDQASYSCEALYGIGTDASMLILGAGISIEKTNYTNVSNVTGWEWKGWSESKTKFAGQVGYRARISDRIGLQFGYDTSQYTYFGVTASF